MMNNFSITTPIIEKMQMEMDKMDFPAHHMWSDNIYEIMKQYITDFEERLDDEHEVGLMLTNFGQSVTMRVTDIKYEYSVLIIFKGYVNENPATLIQHINQLNFLLTSIKKEKDRPKQKVGFID